MCELESFTYVCYNNEYFEGGTTLHNFADIGGGDAPLERCYQLASRSASAQKWRKCKHLIIDEISMVDGKYFEVITLMF